jgi:transglutaminase-like putative cysteine protease
MRICVAQESLYRYEPPATGVIQALRLTPRNHDGQYVVGWRVAVAADCRLDSHEDAFGNIVHAFSVTGQLAELRVSLEGEVETQDTAGVVRGAVERFPPALFRRETALTLPDDAIRAYAVQFPQLGGPDDNPLGVLHSLLTQVHQDIACAPAWGDGDAAPAAETLARRDGDSRALAHLFIATARAIGFSARYVSGYCGIGDDAAAAGSVTAGTRHSWAEAFVPGFGWVGFDPAHCLCVTDLHIRVAVGLDHRDAAPVRGAHFGGAREELDVKLSFSQAAWQTQG